MHNFAKSLGAFFVRVVLVEVGVLAEHAVVKTCSVEKFVLLSSVSDEAWEGSSHIGWMVSSKSRSMGHVEFDEEVQAAKEVLLDLSVGLQSVSCLCGPEVQDLMRMECVFEGVRGGFDQVLCNIGDDDSDPSGINGWCCSDEDEGMTVNFQVSGRVKHRRPAEVHERLSILLEEVSAAGIDVGVQPSQLVVDLSGAVHLGGRLCNLSCGRNAVSNSAWLEFGRVLASLELVRRQLFKGEHGAKVACLFPRRVRLLQASGKRMPLRYYGVGRGLQCGNGGGRLGVGHVDARCRREQ